MPLPLLDPSPVQVTFRTVLFALILGGGGLVWMLRFGDLLRQLPRGIAAGLQHGATRLGNALTSGLGFASIGLTVLAVESGGPGALVWMWIAGVAGVALQSAHNDIARSHQGTKDGLLAAIASRFGALGPMLALACGLGLTAIAVLLGGAFTAQQTSQLLASTTSIGRVWVGLLLVPAIVWAVVRRGKASGAAGKLALLATAGYSLGTLWIVLGDTAATGTALASIFADAFTPGATVAGTAGGSLLAVAEVAILRATEATGAGLGVTAGEVGSDTAADNDATAVATVMPLVYTGVLGTLTTLALLVHTQDAQPAVVSSRALQPLATIQRTATQPSIYGQTFTLPADNQMAPNTRYPMWMYPHPRGHKLGQIADDNRTVGLVAWDNTREIDTLLFHPNGEHRKNPGYDVVVPCTRKETTRQGVPWLELSPIDPELDLTVLMNAHDLDGPYIPLGPILFTGTALSTLAHDGTKGMNMIEEPRDPAGPLYPSLANATKLRFAGPFVRHHEPPQLAWGLASAPESTFAHNTLEHLRLDPAPRGISLGYMTESGYLVVPAWDFLADTRAAVIRHKTDPAQDLMIPVRSELHRGNLRFVSALSDFELGKLQFLVDYEARPYLLPPPYRFDVEVHSGQRLQQSEPDAVALVPTIDYAHRRTDPQSVYTPSPREVLAEADMRGPVLDREGVGRLREAFANRIPGGNWLLLLSLLPLAVLTLGAWLRRGTAAASYALRSHPATARAVVGGLMVAAVVSACGLSLQSLLPALDLSVMALAEINVLALIAFIPLLRAGGRSG